MKFFGSVRPKFLEGKIWYPPFFIRKNFSKRDILSKTVGFVYKNFRQGETKNFRQKNVIPPIMNNVFRYPKSSETLKYAQEFFRYCETIFFRRKVVIPLSCIKFSIPEIFWNIEGMPTKYFGTRRKRMFCRKYVIPSNMHRLFGLPQTFWNIEGMPTNFFGTLGPKIFDRKRDTPSYT